MSRIPSIALSTGLIGAGVLAWAFAARPLITNPDLDAPLNPLGINRSPYGEVFAMAMQGPIDTYFHEGMGNGTHHHEDGGKCDACMAMRPRSEMPHLATSKPTLNARLETLLTSLDKVAEIRTNPKAASDALKRHLRRQAEDKLRFAYQLDPAHYANYNSLHFFLTEPRSAPTRNSPPPPPNSPKTPSNTASSRTRIRAPLSPPPPPPPTSCT